ncbi:hypothetical protein [Kocuria sp. BT304]|uniref:hypothetical protein n=1 Tax=Kocuria sp. BT304 TaxID=1702043 RepID=UPI0013A6A2AA|nr:hypothetical protein [Kocuria sp. BT304]
MILAMVSTTGTAASINLLLDTPLGLIGAATLLIAGLLVSIPSRPSRKNDI